MTHHTIAHRPDMDPATVERVRQELLSEVPVGTDEYGRAYAHFCSRCYVAVMCRSSAEVLNVLIYEALESKDLHRGVSGSGDVRTFTYDQLADALQQLPTFAERYVHGAGTHAQMVRENIALMEEAFLVGCLEYLSNHLRSGRPGRGIPIRFG